MKSAILIGYGLFAYVVGLATGNLNEWMSGVATRVGPNWAYVTCRDAAHQPSPEWAGEKLVVRCVAVVGAGCSR